MAPRRKTRGWELITPKNQILLNNMNPRQLLFTISRYNPAVLFVPLDDAMQEVRIALYQSPENPFKAAQANLNALLAQYGFSRKKGKDKFAAFYNSPSFSEAEEDLLDQIENMYRRQGLTAHQIAEALGIPFNQSFAKLLHQAYPKGLGWGGARRNVQTYAKFIS